MKKIKNWHKLRPSKVLLPEQIQDHLADFDKIDRLKPYLQENAQLTKKRNQSN